MGLMIHKLPLWRSGRTFPVIGGCAVVANCRSAIDKRTWVKAYSVLNKL